jgi:UDP-N-acetylmuramoyl-tripeptide--D-alanyl-D-alanine ligase
MIDSLRLSDLQTVMSADLVGNDTCFTQISTDSRRIGPGALFIALAGHNFDGHRFVAKAVAAGASAVIVSEKQDVPVPQLIVDDTELALGWLGYLNRSKSAALIAAVTGSQGKTSVKEMAGAILREQFKVLVTEGNLNNTIGAPLMLLRLSAEHERAVIELGANHAGEIAHTVAMTNPQIVLLNNAAETHLEGFGSLDGVVQAKGEIIDSASATRTVILNADDPACDIWIRRAGERTLRLFSVQKNDVDYFADRLSAEADGMRFILHSPKGKIDCFLGLPGRHNVANAVAASAIAIEAGAALQSVKNALLAVKPVAGRLCPRPGIKGARLLDDSYNASPSSFRAAIDVLSDIARDSRQSSIVIMGDMAELGDQAIFAHREVGRYAREKGITMFWSVGEFSRFASDGFGDSAKHFETTEELCEHARQLLSNAALVLVKGSRSAGMDLVADCLAKGEKH